MEESMEVLEQTADTDLDSAWEDEETPEREPEKETDPSPELFTLKNRDETRQVTRDELVAMAQKGWDYDTVRAERDQLRQYRRESGPAWEMVRAQAQQKGMTVPAYLEHCRRQDLAQNGPGSPAPQPDVLIQRIKQNARQQDMERFMRTYPTVKAESIPKEVWSQVAQGTPLVSAYAMHENERLRAELAAERQNKANRQRTPGSLGANSAPEPDELDRLWAEDD